MFATSAEHVADAGTSRTIPAMDSCPIERVTRVVGRGREVLDVHREQCGDRVLAFVLNPEDHDALAIAELWGIPVLQGEQVEAGKLHLLCESVSVLIPPFETVDDLVDRWTYHGSRVTHGPSG